MQETMDRFKHKKQPVNDNISTGEIIIHIPVRVRIPVKTVQQ